MADSNKNKASISSSVFLKKIILNCELNLILTQFFSAVEEVAGFTMNGLCLEIRALFLA